MHPPAEATTTAVPLVRDGAARDGGVMLQRLDDDATTRLHHPHATVVVAPGLAALPCYTQGLLVRRRRDLEGIDAGPGDAGRGKDVPGEGDL